MTKKQQRALLLLALLAATVGFIVGKGGWPAEPTPVTKSPAVTPRVAGALTDLWLLSSMPLP